MIALAVFRTIKQLNAPQPVQVLAGPMGMPERVRIEAIKDRDASYQKRPQRRGHVAEKLQAIRTDGQWMDVVSIEDLWKINDEWWRGEDQEIERVYFDLMLENNQRLTIFHDLVRDEWSRQAD